MPSEPAVNDVACNVRKVRHVSLEMSSRVRVEYRAPRENGLGGGWWASDETVRRVRFYGRDPAPHPELDVLPGTERTQRVARMLAAIEKAQVIRIRRLNRARQFRSGMRSLVFFARRNTALRAWPATTMPRWRPNARSPRRVHRRTSRATRRGPPSSSSSEDPPPLIRRLLGLARCRLDAVGIWHWSGWERLAAEAEAERDAYLQSSSTDGWVW
jgi:hypothetical protein